MEFLRFLDLFAALLQSFVVRKIPQLMKQSHRFAPVGDGALWFTSGRIGKSFLGFRILERVEERDALFDCGLHFRRATCREIHFAELIGRRSRQGIRSKGCELKSEKIEEQPESRAKPSPMAHDVPPYCWQRFYLRQLSSVERNLLATGCGGGWTRLWPGGYNGNGAVLQSR